MDRCGNSFESRVVFVSCLRSGVNNDMFNLCQDWAIANYRVSVSDVVMPLSDLQSWQPVVPGYANSFGHAFVDISLKIPV